MEETNMKKRNCTKGSSSSGNGSTSSTSGQYDTVWECVIPYVKEARDRAAVSQVCKRWYAIDAITRKHVTIAFCYSVTPQILSRRFPQLESLKLKGKPRAAMFNLIDENWGGYASAWVTEVVSSLPRMKALHFRRMIVSDSDLEMLANSKTGKILEVLKLDKCSGFSTDGLLHIGRLCRNLRTLYMEESVLVEKDQEWLHELASNNSVLENLNFYMTNLTEVKRVDIELIARRCKSLVSVKISDCDISHLVGFFRAASSLEEFGGGSFSLPPEQIVQDVSNDPLAPYAGVAFPPKLCGLGLTYLGIAEMPIVFPIASKLRKLDLLYSLLDTQGHCELLKRCPNLEFLEARNVIGDRGLEVLAQFCKKIKRLRIERGDDEHEMEDVDGMVTQRGLIALAQNCLEIEYLAVYVSDITNSALECIGTYSKNLSDFRLVLLDRVVSITDLPLDNGVRSLLQGCDRLRRFALYLRPGGLTDVGLSYIGQYSPKIIWMLLGNLGESDKGILEFSKGCPSLKKLEMRGCCFSEGALAMAVLQLTSLRYLWVQGCHPSRDGRGLSAMARPFWNIELIPARQHFVRDEERGIVTIAEDPAHILAYYSLAGGRSDYPDSVRMFDPRVFGNA